MEKSRKRVSRACDFCHKRGLKVCAVLFVRTLSAE